MHTSTPVRGGRSSTKRPRYGIPELFFKTALDDAMVDALLISPALSDRQDVRLKPKFDTACWSYLPPHRIYIGLDLFEKESVRLGLSEEQQAKYIANHYHHERAHGLYTAELAKVSDWCAKRRIPFSLWNLFEDVYIEARYRVNTGYRFNWTELEFTNFGRRPESVLFALIQHEGNYDRLVEFAKTWAPEAGAQDGPLALDAQGSAVAANMHEAARAWLPRVKPYFDRAVRATESMDLAPLIEAWVDEFGLPPKSEDKGDMAQGLALQLSSAALAEFDKDAKPVYEDVEAGEAPPYQPQESDDKLLAKSGQVLVPSLAGEFREGPRARQLAQVLKALFEKEKKTVHSQVPSRRISAKRYALGLPAFRKPLLQGKAKQKVLVVFDMSGSMKGFHAREGQVLLAAFSELARMGLISGHVVFSAVTASNRASHETYALPLSDHFLGSVAPCHGAEGLDAAIRSNLELAKEADHVFVYTDANISDHKVDKRGLHAKGVFTFGLYVGNDPEAHGRLMKYFDKGVVRKSVEDLVGAVLTEYR